MENRAEAARLAALAANKALPLVYFDVEVQARLCTHVGPLQGEHTRKASTGSVTVPKSPLKLTVRSLSRHLTWMWRSFSAGAQNRCYC